MEEIKENIAKAIMEAIESQVSYEDILSKIEIPKDTNNGDFAYPCFNLAKVLKKAPVLIANEIKEKIDFKTYCEKIEKVEVVNGYLNFYVKTGNIAEKVLKEILEKKENISYINEGEGKKVLVDYSSPNIAKPFHLGHFMNTVIGRAICNLNKELGYEVVGINHLGDWGRQFGLLIEGYKLFKSDYDIEKDPLHVLSDIYVRISKLAKEDESVMDKARENFKKLEEGDEEYLKLWQYFRDVSLKEYKRIYDILGCKFDSYNGEAFYNDKMDEIIDILNKKGVLKISQGAKVVEMPGNMPPCIIVKSNGSTIYATRDLAAILYRARTYDYTKNIYITSYEQIDHFKQVFEVAKYLVDEKYVKGLSHVPYGMVRLKTGKMSTREGNVIYLQDVIEEAITKANKIIESKNSELEDKENIARKVGLGALVFHFLKNNKIKDVIFNLDEILSFDGETGPYVQYTYVRTQSILKKAEFDENNIKFNDIDFSILEKTQEIELIKLLDKFKEVIKKATDTYEPSVLTRYIIDVASAFSKFYNECPVICDDEKLKQARLILTYATSVVVKKGLSILGIDSPERM